jgi:hypothetical protein
VFRPVFVADGNFKADHVKQKNNDDVWLMDGGGMVPNQKHYSDFLKKAMEIPTVSRIPITKPGPQRSPRPAIPDLDPFSIVPDPDPVPFPFPSLTQFIIRKLPVKKDSRPSKGLFWRLRPAILLESWPLHVQDMDALYPTLSGTCT